MDKFYNTPFYIYSVEDQLTSENTTSQVFYFRQDFYRTQLTTQHTPNFFLTNQYFHFITLKNFNNLHTFFLIKY